MKRKYVVIGLGVIGALAIAWPVLAGQSLSSMVRQEVAKQLSSAQSAKSKKGRPGPPGPAGPAGPTGPQGPTGVTGSQGPGGGGLLTGRINSLGSAAPTFGAVSGT